MSSGEIIALVCVLALLPLWAAGSIIRFALGTCKCGVLLDPYADSEGGGGKRGDCPMKPHGPQDDGGEGPEGTGPRPDWWPQFERELGRYVAEQKCPVRRDRDVEPVE